MPFLQPFSQLTRDVAGAVIAEQSWLVDHMHLIGLCRKVFQRLSESLSWTQLSCEGCELLERRHTILTELPLSDHVRGFDPSQCCSC